MKGNMKDSDIQNIIKLLNTEIMWCEKHPDKAFHKEYRKGFINGLIQSKYLITQFKLSE